MTLESLRPSTPMRRAWALAPVIGLLVAACSGSAATPARATSSALPSAAATITMAPSATPVATRGPATQSLTLTGPTGAAGAISNAAILCNLPSTDGLQISVLGQPTDPSLSVYIFVEPGKLTVRFDSGAGATYVERDFTGTGVSDFNAATGAQIDSQLTEVPTTGAHGTLGLLTSISGSIDCGNQMPGSSTLTLSGPTPKGALGGGLDPVNVECVTNQYGPSVSILGLAQVGSAPTLLVVYVRPGSFSVSASGDAFFTSGSAVVATLTATGAHVDGDAVEQLAAGSKVKPHTIHVSGDATCGTTVGG